MIGTTEAIIIGGIVILLFGAKKLPELAKSMGQSKAAFDQGIQEGHASEEDEDESEWYSFDPWILSIEREYW